MLCRIYQWRIEYTLDEGRQLGPIIEKHLQQCDVCRTFYHSLVQLDAELKASEPPHISNAQVRQMLDRTLQRLAENTTGRVSSKTPHFRFKSRFPATWKNAAAILITAGLFTVGYTLFKPLDSVEPGDPKV
jgi:hypothetical protein